MRFVQYLLREKASNTIGFALVAPILIGCFLAVAQIANLSNVQVTLESAAKSAAREGSRYDGTHRDAQVQANKVLAGQGLQDGALVEVRNVFFGDARLVEVTITKKYRISWLGYDLILTSVGKSVDEKVL